MNSSLAAAALAMSLVATNALSAPVFSGPLPYLSPSDSPYSALEFEYFHLEDWEDGLLNTPGVTATPGWGHVNLGGQNDSIENGFAGGSFYSGFSTSNTAVTFTFDANELGRLPTHAGVVWTDVGPDTTSGGIGNQPVFFSATSATGRELGVIGPFIVGDTSTFNQKNEDRFFGVFNADGISSITVDMVERTNWEVDHLQYGGLTPVPLPASLLLLTTATALLLGRSASRRSPA